MMAVQDGNLPPVLMIVRMQKFGDRFILAEDTAGRHFMVDKTDAGPIRQVVYFDYYLSERKH